MKKLEQVKDLLSHTLPEGTWADAIAHLAEKHLQKTLGKGGASARRKVNPSFTTARKRIAIKITLRRRLLKKAKYCCEFVDTKTKTKCQSHYQLQIDHRIPLARGGSDVESNLRVLCRTHNLLATKQWGL